MIDSRSSKTVRKKTSGCAGDVPPGRRSERVFVYGTLRSGGGLAAGLLRDAERAGPATTNGQLLAGPGYPALVTGGAGEVHGEIWFCDPETLAALDSYEGVAEGLFRRVRVEAGGAPAWVYVAGERLRQQQLPVIEGGDWLAWLATRTG